MATSSRSTERFKYGICLNDECPLCKQKKIQQIPMRKDLVCTNPECGKPLRECPPPKTGINKKLIGIIAGAVIGIAAIGGGIYALTRGGGPEPDRVDKGKDIPQLILNHSSKTLKVGETDTLNATITPEGSQAIFEWKASKDGTVEVQDGIVKALKGGSGKVRVQAIIGKDTLKTTCIYTVEGGEGTKLITSLAIEGGNFSLTVGSKKKLTCKVEPVDNEENIIWESSEESVATVDDEGLVRAVREGKTEILAKASKVTSTSVTVTVNTKDVGGPREPWANYATFDGTTMTFTKRHIIPGTNQTANPGDKVTGKWVNGEVNLVRWYHDGTSETLTHK